jgi:hypothetical protein
MPAESQYFEFTEENEKRRKRVMRRSPASKMVFLIFLLVFSALLGGGVFVGLARATEGGGGAYPNGAEDFMAGALPPPGNYFLNYLTYYASSKFKGSNGNDLMPKFDLDVVANVFRLVHVTKHNILGANWAVHAFLPLVYQDVDVPGRGEVRWGIGDIIVDPIILGWHWPNLHITAGLDIYIPSGSYDKDKLANAGRNTWTLEPVFGITYLDKSGLELSGKFMYDFNLKNNDTKYQSGEEFHFDYTVGYHVNKQLALGLGGYYYFQTTEDKLNGATVGDGNKGKVLSIGPQAKYDYKNMSFTLKWQHEWGAENKPQGEKFWFKFMYAL